MANFQEICHRNCALGYVGRIFKLRKIEFRGLEGQFDFKNANFMGLIPKIGYFRPILTSRFCLGIFALLYIGGILELKKLDFRGLKCQSDVKKVNFRGLIAKIG